MTGKYKELGSTALYILIASLIYAFGFNWCFAPNNFSFGGITGIAQIIHKFVPVLPVGTLALMMNLPLFLLGWKLLGGKVLINSLCAMALGSLMIDGMNLVYSFQPMEEPLLACLYGGAITGLALGLLLRRGITTGGTDLGARLLKLKWKHLPIGQLLLTLDVAVVACHTIAFRELNLALYSVVALYVSSLVLDRVVYGGNAAKVAFIVSDRHQEIAAELMRSLERGVTVLHGQGAWSGSEKEALYCVFKPNQIAQLKHLVHTIDPNAFLVVSEAHEVLGDGFNLYSADSV